MKSSRNLTIDKICNVIAKEFKSKSFDIDKIEAIIDQYKDQGGDLNKRPIFSFTILQKVTLLFLSSIKPGEALLENKILKTVKLLVEKGASHKATCSTEDTPISRAKKYGLKEVESYLNTTEDLYFPTKIDKRQDEVLDLLKKHNTGLTIHGCDDYKTLLHKEAVIKNFELVKFLVEKHGLDASPRSLIQAAQHGPLEVVEYLFNQNIYNKHQAMNLLYCAVERSEDSPKVIEFLIQNGNVNINERPGFLHKALRKQNYETAKILVQYGIDVNIACDLYELGAFHRTSDFYETPLEIVIKAGNLAMVQYLIVNGANTQKLDIGLIKDATIAQTVSIAKVIQNLCKFKGHENNIELGEITEQEHLFVKEIMTNYLIKTGIKTDFYTHLEEFASANLKELLPYVKECIDGSNQDLQILEGLLLEQTQEGLSEVPYQLLLSAQKAGLKIDDEGIKVLDFYKMNSECQVLGTYLLATIAEKEKGVPILNQVMLRDQHIAELVIDLSKRIMPPKIKLELKKAVKNHQLYNTLQEFQHLKNPVPINSNDEFLAGTEDLDDTEKPTKVVLGDFDSLD